jgi:drug/metabolite transporter (DMT)-like permease
VLAILIPAALLVSGRRARGWNERGHAMIVGMLLHGAYLGGVFWAIRHGMPAGVAALIVSLQPVLTSVLSAPAARRETGGAALAGAGSRPRRRGADPRAGPGACAGCRHGITGADHRATVVSLGGITAGTIYQKRFAPPARPARRHGLAICRRGRSGRRRFARLRDPRHPLDAEIHLRAWLAGLVLSIGAISLLMLLIRQNAVASVSGLFYLVPAVHLGDCLFHVRRNPRPAPVRRPGCWPRSPC